MSFMSLYGPFLKTGTRQNFRLVISDTAAVYSAEEFALDPSLPTQGYDAVSKEEIVIPKGTLVAIKPMPRTYRGRPVLTIANGGVSTNDVNGLPYAEGARAANVVIGIAHYNITKRAYFQVADMSFGILIKDAYIEIPYVEMVNDSNGQLYSGAVLKSDTNGNFVLYQGVGAPDAANFETSFGLSMIPANDKSTAEHICGKLLTVIPQVPSLWEEWMTAAPAAGIVDWTKPLLPYHDNNFNVIANPKGAVYNVGSANRVGALVTSVAMAAQNAAKAGSYLLTAIDATHISVTDISAGTSRTVTVAAGATTEDLIPGVRITLGAVINAADKATVDVLLSATVHGLKGINDLVSARPELAGAARDAFRPFGVLRIILQ